MLSEIGFDELQKGKKKIEIAGIRNKYNCFSYCKDKSELVCVICFNYHKIKLFS